MKMKRIMGALLCALLAVPALAAQAEAVSTQDASWWQPRAPRILVLKDASLAGDKDYNDELTGELIRLLQRQLVKSGHKVVLSTEVRNLQRRAAALQDAYIGKTETSFEQFLCEASQSDYLLRVASRVDSEKTKQGRMFSDIRVDWTMSAAQDPAIVRMDMAKGSDRSVDSYDDAREKALESACGSVGSEGSIVANIAQAITEKVNEERELGRKYYVNLQSNVKELNRVLLSLDDLRSIDGMNPDIEGPPATPERLSYEVRFRGSLLSLREALTNRLEEKRASIAQETGEDFSIMFATSQRSIDALMNPRESDPESMESELIRELENLARYLYRKNQDWYIGTPVKFQPAHVASAQAKRSAAEDFVRKYWATYEEIRQSQELADPLSYTGSVTIDGVAFDNLRAAKAEAEKATADYYNSEAGQLATSLAGMTEQAFKSVSEDKIKGQIDGDAERDVLFMIKSEMDLYQHEGAIEPESVAFFTRQGTERMVFTRLNRVLDTYRLWVTAVDANNGMKQTSSVELPAHLTERLDARLGTAK